MGLRDRTYWKDSAGGGGGVGGLGGMRLGFPRPTRAVTILIILCTVVFFLTLATGASESPLYPWVWLEIPRGFELWRWITFQFMHGGAEHFLFNMMGLYFFGPSLERLWGSRRFVLFYLVCGVTAGLTFAVLTIIWPMSGRLPLVGASGGILGCLAACAILFPQQIVFIVPIRWFAAFLVVLYLLNIAWLGRSGYAALQDAAHLGGMIGAALWIGLLPGVRRALAGGQSRLREGAWKRKQEAQARRRAEVDRILDKVHRDGIGSLSGREKKTLQEETRRQREEDGAA